MNVTQYTVDMRRRAARGRYHHSERTRRDWVRYVAEAESLDAIERGFGL